jgi:hypothetical protein
MFRCHFQTYQIALTAFSWHENIVTHVEFSVCIEKHAKNYQVFFMLLQLIGIRCTFFAINTFNEELFFYTHNFIISSAVCRIKLLISLTKILLFFNEVDGIKGKCG